MEKMTAVQWLINELKTGDFDNAPISVMLGIIERALEMEREQIIDSFNYGQFDLGMEAEEYYNETFKSK